MTTAVRCPRCGADVTPAEHFCENCGAALATVADGATAPMTATDSAFPGPASLLGSAQGAGSESDSPITLSRPVNRISETEETLPILPPGARLCAACGGVVGADGYCETCGTKAPSERDHYVEQPAPWVAACCDRGIRHHRNEDATAIAADPEPGSRAVLIVCDGVSTSEDSDVASLAGARAARDALVSARPAGLGVPESQEAAMVAAFGPAVTAANEAVIRHTRAESQNAAAATFAGAVVDGDLVAYAAVGDSRVYWLPDAGQPRQLSVDDSVAQLRIDSGVTREEAERGPQAHAITKWLGRDSADPTPSTGSLHLDAPGWLLVCSDGLWNYASTAEQLQLVVAELGAQVGPAPRPLAEALVRWACEQGGRDNISVALARH